jgi:hypothetical protein
MQSLSQDGSAIPPKKNIHWYLTIFFFSEERNFFLIPVMVKSCYTVIWKYNSTQREGLMYTGTYFDGKQGMPLLIFCSKLNIDIKCIAGWYNHRKVKWSTRRLVSA